MNRKYAKIALMLFACIMLVSCGKNGETEISESVKKGGIEHTSKYRLEESETQNTVEFNDSGIRVLFTKLIYDDGVTRLAYSAQNSNDYPVTIVSDNISFNGMVCSDSLNIKLLKDGKQLGTFDVGNDWFSKMGIEKITDVEFTVTAFDENGSEITRSDLLSIKTDALGEYKQAYETHGTELFSGKNIKILSREIRKSDHSNDAELVLYVENNSKKTVTVVTSDVSVNDKEINATYISTLSPGKKSVDTLLLSENALKENEISEIKKVCANFKAYNDDFEIVFETGILNIPLEMPE